MNTILNFWLALRLKSCCHGLSHIHVTCIPFACQRFKTCQSTLRYPVVLVLKPLAAFQEKWLSQPFKGLKKDSNFKIILRRELGQAFYNYSSLPDAYVIHFLCLYKITHKFPNNLKDSFFLHWVHNCVWYCSILEL